MKEHLDKHERCKNCYHLSSCAVWVRHGTTLYDDYDYSVENCPYYISATDVVEVRHGEWKSVYSNNMGIVYECSECGHLELGTSDYCICGAKMI